MKKSILKDKSKAFALEIIKMTDLIQCEKRVYVLTKQVLRSGTSIGANIHEAFFGQSLPDFISKLSIALKECGETQYWLDLLHDSQKLGESDYQNLIFHCEELGKILTSSIKTAKETLNKRKNYLKSAYEVQEPTPNYGQNDDSIESLLIHYSL
ncbi:MAG: four helix bundle protein [Muribaculaceae bacterium]|nr:four helix bundle protein [Muribaculaceae bacterium]